MGILSIFGYDRKSQDAYVDAQKAARDQAYVDSWKIEEAAGMLRSQIGNIEGAAGAMFRAGEMAAGIGRANAANIMAETGEWARRRTGAQQSEQSMNRALAAASGIRLGTGGSSDIFQSAVKGEHAKEIAWGWKAGRSQADIATREGQYAKQQAISAGEGILAQIPGVLSQASLYDTEASALRTSSDLAVAEARANRASARSGAYMSLVTTAISAVATAGALGAFSGAGSAITAGGGTTGLSGGLVGGGVLGTGLTGGQLALGIGAVGAGISALGMIAGAKNPSASEIAGAYNVNTSAPRVAGVNTGAGLDTSKLPAARPYKAPMLPGAEKASPTTKRQYAAQQTKKAKTDTNIFGATGNPIAVGA